MHSTDSFCSLSNCHLRRKKTLLQFICCFQAHDIFTPFPGPLVDLLLFLV